MVYDNGYVGGPSQEKDFGKKEDRKTTAAPRAGLYIQTKSCEEIMMSLRFEIYNLISEHISDKEVALHLKKVIEYAFR